MVKIKLDYDVLGFVLLALFAFYVLMQFTTDPPLALSLLLLALLSLIHKAKLEEGMSKLRASLVPSIEQLDKHILALADISTNLGQQLRANEKEGELERRLSQLETEVKRLSSDLAAYMGYLESCIRNLNRAEEKE